VPLAELRLDAEPVEASRTNTARATTPVRPTSPLGCSQISSNADARW